MDKGKGSANRNLLNMIEVTKYCFEWLVTVHLFTSVVEEIAILNKIDCCRTVKEQHKFDVRASAYRGQDVNRSIGSVRMVVVMVARVTRAVVMMIIILIMILIECILVTII